MKKNKIIAIIASTVMAAVTCAAMNSFAATYVAPELEQVQDTTKVMIVYNFTSWDTIHSQAEAAYEEYIAEIGPNAEPERDVFDEFEQKELEQRRTTRESIASEIGFSLDEASYCRDDPDFEPVMVCTLTSEQIVAAETNDLIIAIADLSLGEWFTPKTYETVNLTDEGAIKLRGTVYFEHEDKDVIYSAVEEKVTALKAYLEKQYNDITWSRIMDFYELNCIWYMGDNAQKSITDSAMAALGITDEDIICRTEGRAGIVIEACKQTFEELKNCSFVTEVVYYDPDEQMPTDMPIEEIMTIPPPDDFGSILPGDANCDYKLNLNDAVAVLQYIALPEKYPLTSQGQINADCDGNPGITGGDALWIQQQDAENI